MVIMRDGGGFKVVGEKGVELATNLSFECAREFMADRGCKDAEGKLVTRSRHDENDEIQYYKIGMERK